jgi:hypothetical protein
MLPAKLDPFRRSVIDIFGSADKLWRHSGLHTPHHRQQHVVLGFERTGVCAVHLPDVPGAGPAGAVAHAADAEVEVEKVELSRWERHGGGELLVVALRVVGCDDLALHAVVGEDLAAEGPEAGQVGIEGGDVEGVELRGICDVGQGEVLRVPGRIVVDGVAVPVCRVGEGLAREVDVEGRQLGAGLEAREDESPVEAVEVGENAGDAGCLLTVETGGFVGGGGAANQGGEDGAAEVGVFDYTGGKGMRQRFGYELGDGNSRETYPSIAPSIPSH